MYLDTKGPAYAQLVLIAHAQKLKPLINAYADVTYGLVVYYIVCIFIYIYTLCILSEKALKSLSPRYSTVRLVQQAHALALDVQ